MLLQSNSLLAQEAASKAFNDYIQYLYIFDKSELDKTDENATDNSSGSNHHAIPLTNA